VERACQILSRLPRTSPRVDFYNYAAVWDSEEVAKYCNQSTDNHSEWGKLKVVAAVSSTVIKLSLQIATSNKHPNFGLARSMQYYVQASGRGQQSSIDAGYLHRDLHCTGVSMEYMAAVSNAVFLLYNGGDVGMCCTRGNSTNCGHCDEQAHFLTPHYGQPSTAGTSTTTVTCEDRPLSCG